MKFFALLVLLVGLVAALWLVDRDPVAGLVVYCALAALACGLAALGIEPAGTPWGPYWCPACDVERLDRITAQLEDLATGDWDGAR